MCSLALRLTEKMYTVKYLANLFDHERVIGCTICLILLSLWQHSGRSTVGFYEFGSVLQAHNVTWQHARSKMLGRDWLPMCSRSWNPFVISRPSPPLTCVGCHSSPHVNPLNVGRIQGLVWGKGHLQLLYTLYVCVCENM